MKTFKEFLNESYNEDNFDKWLDKESAVVGTELYAVHGNNYIRVVRDDNHSTWRVVSVKTGDIFKAGSGNKPTGRAIGNISSVR